MNEAQAFFRLNSRRLADVCAKADLHEDKVRQAYADCMHAVATGDKAFTRHRMGL